MTGKKTRESTTSTPTVTVCLLPAGVQELGERPLPGPRVQVLAAGDNTIEIQHYRLVVLQTEALRVRVGLYAHAWSREATKSQFTISQKASR